MNNEYNGNPCNISSGILDIVILIITMQLMVRIEDVQVAEVVLLPSMQVKEGAPFTEYLAI